MGFFERLLHVDWYRLLTYFLPIPALIFFTLSLTGCVSNAPLIPDIYMLRITGDDGLEVRVGYFAMCIASQSSPLHCTTTAGKSTAAILSHSNLDANSTDAISSTIDLARSLQTRYILSLVSGPALLFFLTLFPITFLHFWRKAACPVRTLLQYISTTAVWTAASFTLAAAFSFDQTVNAVAFMSRSSANSSNVLITPGKTLSILQWAALGVLVIFGLLLRILYAFEDNDRTTELPDGKTEDTFNRAERKNSKLLLPIYSLYKSRDQIASMYTDPRPAPTPPPSRGFRS